ncbi:MAG: hypothetical protein JOZ18_14730 [Chloroflexi bacterium]|nr:hypothetical protein [Chloroflexota bacterium]
MKKATHENITSLYEATTTQKTGEETKNDKTNEQKQENVYRCLDRAVEVIEKDINSTPHIMMKRIEADAAVIATLNIVAELLPPHIQEQIKKVIALHNEAWKTETLSPEGDTPRKPLAQSLQHWIQRFTLITHK